MDFIAQFKKDEQSRHLFTQDAKFAVTTVADKPVTLSGYALVWGELSSDRGGYRVRLKPYSATVQASSFALYHHDAKLVIGNTENGTLRYSLDDVGLKVEIDLPDTSTGRDVAKLVGKKYIKGMSFGMLINPEPELEAVVEAGQTILEFSKFTLDEVTITGRPAFTQTSISVKPPPLEGEFARAASVRLERVKLDRLRLGMLGA